LPRDKDDLRERNGYFLSRTIIKKATSGVESNLCAVSLLGFGKISGYDREVSIATRSKDPRAGAQSAPHNGNVCRGNCGISVTAAENAASHYACHFSYTFVA